MKRRVLLLALLLSLFLPRPANAHDVAVSGVARIFLDQIGERRYVLSVVDIQVPPIMSSVLPEHCHVIPSEAAGIRISRGFVFECEEPLTFDDSLILPWPLEGVVAVVRWADGNNASAYFRGDHTKVVVSMAALRAGPGSAGRLARRSVQFGLEHILFGIDHLLFLVGLFLLARPIRKRIAMITVFTVANGLALGAAFLGFVSIPNGPIDAAIALSIALLAREIVVAGRGETHLVHRRPWVVAAFFGVLHGFGSAGTLGQIGLRQADVPIALLGFNVGIELGQLAVIAIVVLVQWLVAPLLRGRAPALLEQTLGYAVGIVAAFWFFQRLPAVWGG